MDESAPFQIRDFPVALRKEIVAEAEAARVSVSEFMSGVCAVSRAAGWPRAVDAAGKLNGVTSRLQERGGLDLVALAPLVPAMPRWLRAALWRRVARDMGVEAPDVRKRPLPDGTPSGLLKTRHGVLSHGAENPPSDEPKPHE